MQRNENTYAPVAIESPPVEALVDQPAPSPAYTESEINLNGRWIDNYDGSVIMMSQEGPRVQMITTLNGIAVEGEGSLSGRQLYMTLSVAGVKFSSMQMTLDASGRLMQGTSVNAEGKATAIGLHR